MNIFVTGGTGFVGQAMTAHLLGLGHEVTILSRSAGNADDRIRRIEGNPKQAGAWQKAAADADVVVNLAGSSIFQRWTDDVKEELYDSRILTTQNVVDAMASVSRPDRVLLSTSAIGYYGDRGDDELTESERPGKDFLADLSVDWEKEALAAEKAGIRVCIMRFGVVLDAGGGALEQMMRVFKWGIGGRLGDGRQWFSWIHREDLVRAAGFLIGRPDASGPFNFTAPEPVRNSELTRELAEAMHRPAFLPAPSFMIRLAMGEMAGMLLGGQKVLPAKLKEHGFEFRFPAIRRALADIVSRA